MKKKLAYLMLGLVAALLFLCSVSAHGQKKRDTGPRPVQIQVVDSSAYLVQFVPLDEARANVSAQLVQAEKQLQTVDKQIADLVKKRDGILQQKTELETFLGQLKPLPPAPLPAPSAGASTTTPTDKPQKGKKGKSKKKN